jgi:ABC-type uncharacterized transport system involved in gliding motility auxiliary subunit
VWERATQRLILIIGVIGIVVLANIVGARHHWRLDLTESKRYTLSPQTKEVLARLTTPVTLLGFLEKDTDAARRVEALLQEYDYASPKVRVELVDPVVEPARARQFGVQYYNTVVVECGGKTRKVEPYNLFGMGATPYETEFRGEQAITRAILDLVHQTGAVIYFLEGHGGGTLSKDFYGWRNYLEGEGYTVKSLNLATAGKVPADASLLVLPGPRQDLSGAELEALQGYLGGGGRLLVLVDPLSQPLPRLEELLAGIGVKLHQDVVVDPKRAFFFDALSPVPVLQPHPVTQKMLEQEVNLLLPRSRSLAALPSGDGRFKVQPLLRSSSEAWGETNLADPKFRRDADDLSGPLNLAVAVTRVAEKGQNEGTEEEGTPVAIVVGNSALAREQALDFQGNADFLVNGVNWLVGEAQMLTIRPKEESVRLVHLDPDQAVLVFYSSTVFLPAAVLIFGLGVWLRRRAR